MNRYVDTDDVRGYARNSAALMDDEPADREISLGTPTILAIFFGLALVCAAFFGFGYTMGRRSVPPVPVSVEATPAIGSVTNKPSAASLPSIAPNLTPDAPTAVEPLDKTAGSAASDPTPAADKPAALAPPQPASPAPAATSFQPSAAGAASSSIPGQLWVQIAAVSSQEIADIEVAALKKDGYAVVIRHEPQDKLLHVQIGPFTDKKAAEAMRQKVLADGFNAIVK